MIRAVVKNGVIQPLEPLPSDWEDGREVVVDSRQGQGPPCAEEFDRWSAEMQALTAGLNDPQEWQQIEAVLGEADRQNKDGVRREMGLP